MTRELDEYEIFEADVALAFFKYLNMFNLLEMNIGLCISGLDKGSDRETTQRRLSGLTMHKKMDVLKELITENGAEADDGLKSDFDEWFQFAASSKAARNRYVHGYWDIIPPVYEKPIRFTPHQWVDKDGSEKTSSRTERMTMDEFLAMTAEMDGVFEKFRKLREKYGI